MNREELEAETGVSARNIRYLITEGILPPPEGPARAARYSEEHLRILRIYTEAKAEGIASLDVIRRRITGEGSRSMISVMPGIELTIEPENVPAGASVEDIMAALRIAVEAKLGRI